jgi:hypothetical protein
MHNRKEGFMRKGLVGLLVAVMLVFVLASAGAVMADNIAYEATGSNDFGTVDLNTGVYTEIGNMGLRLSGLGVANGVIYGGGYYGSSTLYSVNPTSGALTAVGMGSIAYGLTGSTLTGLYAVDNSGANLYSVNPSTGATTIIGPTGISFSGYSGFSTNSSTLYLTTGTSLYTVNTSTGAATLVGSTGAGIGALVTESGVLYGGVESPLSVQTVNPATGALTFVANESGAPGNFWGLTPLPTPVPVPGAVLLLGPGLVGLAAIRRRFKK